MFDVILAVGLVLLSLLLTALAGVTLWWMLHAWRTPADLKDTEFDRAPDEPALSFSLIVPARHEQAVLAATLTKLGGMSHPNFEILVVVGHDDPETEQVAREVEAAAPKRVRIFVDETGAHRPQLNFARVAARVAAASTSANRALCVVIEKN